VESSAGATHRETEPARKAARARQAIPPALRRKVMRRDHGRCRVPGCRSARNLDQHHIVPRAQGGANTEENVLTLCESHHLALHGGALIIVGAASNPTFTRRAHNSFAIAERAVETGKALKALGFDKHEVASAVNAARTHVGTAELSLEQWIQIALGYCPKPTA
jgi:predicted restriction endonuclease